MLSSFAARFRFHPVRSNAQPIACTSACTRSFCSEGKGGSAYSEAFAESIEPERVLGSVSLSVSMFFTADSKVFIAVLRPTKTRLLISRTRISPQGLPHQAALNRNHIVPFYTNRQRTLNRLDRYHQIPLFVLRYEDAFHPVQRASSYPNPLPHSQVGMIHKRQLARHKGFHRFDLTFGYGGCVSGSADEVHDSRYFQNPHAVFRRSGCSHEGVAGEQGQFHCLVS